MISMIIYEIIATLWVPFVPANVTQDVEQRGHTRALGLPQASLAAAPSEVRRGRHRNAAKRMRSAKEQSFMGKWSAIESGTQQLYMTIVMTV